MKKTYLTILFLTILFANRQLEFYAESDIFTVDSQDPYVLVLSPDGGEILNYNNQTALTWSAMDNSLGDTPVSVFISPYYYGDSIEILSAISNSGYVEVQLPEIETDYARILIQVIDNFGNSGLDWSDHYFSIVSEGWVLFEEESEEFTVDSSPPQITVISPNGGEEFDYSDDISVYWFAEDEGLADHPINLGVSTENPQNYEYVVNSLVNTGVYETMFPQVTTDYGRVLITATDQFGNIANDISDGYFRLRENISESASLTGIIVEVTSGLAISGANVTINSGSNYFQTTTNGVGWYIFSNIDPGSYSLQITKREYEPQTDQINLMPGEEYAANYSMDHADSENGFGVSQSIIVDSQDPLLTLITPGGGDIIDLDNGLEVEWEAADNSFGLTPISLNISLSENVNYQTLETAAANSGYILTMPPNINTDFAMVEIVASDQFGNMSVDESGSYFSLTGGSSNYATLSGTVTNSITQSPVEFAHVQMYPSIDNFDSITNSEGNYQIYMQGGYGYDLEVSANGFETFYDSDYDFPIGSNTTLDFELTPVDREYIITDYISSSLVSKVPHGGKAFRYYKVVDQNTGLACSQVPIMINDGDFECFDCISNPDGIITVRINSEDVGNGIPGSIEEFTITHLDGQAIEEDIQSELEFTAQVFPSEFSKHWNTKQYGHINISHFSVEYESGASVSLIENDGDSFMADEIKINRQLRAGGGASVGVGAEAVITIGDVIDLGGGATASAGGNVSIITEDRYGFDWQDYNEWDAGLQYILFADGSYNAIDLTMARILTVCQDLFSDETTIYNAYLSDKKGIDIKGFGEAGAMFDNTLGPISASGLGIELAGGVGAEFHGIISRTNDNENSQASIDLGGSVVLEAQFHSDIMLSINQLLQIEYISEIEDFLGVDLDYSAILGSEISFVTDHNGSFEEVQFTLMVRNVINGTGQEVWFTYHITEETIINTVTSIVTQLQVLADPPENHVENIVISDDLFIYILETIFDAVNEFQETAENFVVPFEIRRVMVDEISAFPVRVALDIEALLQVSFDVGGGEGFERQHTDMLVSGVWKSGHHLPLELHHDLPIIDTGFDEVIEDIITNLPQSIQNAIAILDFLNPFGGRETVWQLENGSHLAFNEGAIPDTVSQMQCSSWGWWGADSRMLSSQLDDQSRQIHAHNKSRAIEDYDMEFGIGGFYQFEPYNLPMLDSAMFTIVYSDSEVVNIDETSLGMYYNDKRNHQWRYIGGIVDTLNNTVTALVDTLNLITLAPSVPYGSFGLFPEADTLIANGSSTTLISSDIIHNNDGSVIDDGSVFTVGTDAGTIISQDMNLELSGIQVGTFNGMIQFEIQADSVGFTANIIALSGNGSARGETSVVFLDDEPPFAPIIESFSAGDEFVTMEWSQSPGADIAGYLIYYDNDAPGPPYDGIASVWGSPSPINVDNALSRTVFGLSNDIEYYFAVTAYDLSGNESDLSNEIQATPSPVLMGDVNNDGTINVSDIVDIVAIILENMEPTEYQLIASDVTGDGQINVSDIVELVDMILNQ